MGRKPWRPADEAEATSNRGVFIEWLRATERAPDAGPADVPAWQSDLDVMAEFVGLRRDAGWAGNLRLCRGRREAVVRLAPEARRAWSRDALADSDAAWREAVGPVPEQPWETLVRIVASHLLDAETRPDDRLLWGGDPCDPWPWGALAIGATLIVGGEAAALAEAASFRRLAPGWGGR